jgi:hypothetical protein
MTPAQRDRLTGFNASLKQRGVSVTLHTNTPVDAAVQCLALIEAVTAKSRQQLEIADEQITHLVHVLRTSLADANGNPFDRKTVTEIDRADSDHTYRVQNFTDDAQRPAVLFHSILA